MQIVVCISMINFMAGNGEHEKGIFATSTGKVVRRTHDNVMSHSTKW